MLISFGIKRLITGKFASSDYRNYWDAFLHQWIYLQVKCNRFLRNLIDKAFENKKGKNSRENFLEICIETHCFLLRTYEFNDENFLVTALLVQL